jgi:hypothetical protein
VPWAESVPTKSSSLFIATGADATVAPKLRAVSVNKLRSSRHSTRNRRAMARLEALVIEKRRLRRENIEVSSLV